MQHVQRLERMRIRLKQGLVDCNVEADTTSRRKVHNREMQDRISRAASREGIWARNIVVLVNGKATRTGTVR